MLRTLLAKDLRLQKPVMVAALLLFLAPLTVWRVVSVVQPPVRPSVPEVDRAYIHNEIASMIFLGAITAALVGPALAGVAAARERRDRSGEFLESLPAPRGMIVTSRVVAALICVLMPWGLGIGLALWIASESVPYQESISWAAVKEPMCVFAPASLMAAGVAWLVGSLGKSDVVPGAIGLGATVAPGSPLLTWRTACARAAK